MPLYAIICLFTDISCHPCTVQLRAAKQPNGAFYLIGQLSSVTPEVVSEILNLLRPRADNTAVDTVRCAIPSANIAAAATHLASTSLFLSAHAAAAGVVIDHRMYHSTQPSGKKINPSGKGSANPHLSWQ
mmetsp:Transcript_11986/g.20244  ORF Transcript_11986/g.20244 Transcript_11986/m.20244 type:complete len:130 (+) Transcript_11986:286-675(+)